MNVNQNVSLNLTADGIPPRLHMAQGDSNTRTIVASLWDDSQPYNVPASAVVMMRFRKPDGTGGLYDVTEGGAKISVSGNVVTIPVATQLLTVAGVVFAQVDVYGAATGAAAEKLATFRLAIEVAPSVYPDANIISSDYYNILTAKVAEAVAAADQAKRSQGAAAASAAAAATSAANAAASAAGAVKYNAPQTLTAEQQAQARNNINAPAPYEAGENISITGRIITTKAFPCNPNLLDNWYLGNPVNQRGASGTISTAGYFFDRWKLVSGSVTINSGGIVLNGTIAQVLEYAVGQTVTATVLTPDGVTDVTPVYDDETKTFAVTTQGKTIRAVKLELGFQQTLAHQENGAWVLNEIPKFGDQLAECQRYLRPAGYSFVVSNATGSWYGSSVFVSPEPMRAVPVIVNGDYMNKPIREVTGGQCAAVASVFLPNIYGQFAVQLSPLGSTIPNYVYVDATEFNPLLSAEL